MAPALYDVACVFLFSLEVYHIIAHVMILSGMRTLPRKDLVRIRYYFLIDALTVFASSFLLTGKMRWLAVLQIIQHMFYFITWDKSYLAKRIIDWSSLDWFRYTKASQVDCFLGTSFDVVVHLCMAVAIGQLLNIPQLVLGMILAQAALYIVVFNPRFAWSSPSKIPDWVQRRLGKLSLDD